MTSSQVVVAGWITIGLISVRDILHTVVSLFSKRQGRTNATYLKLTGMFELVKVRLQFQSFFQVLQELPLERVDLLDVAE